MCQVLVGHGQRFWTGGLLPFSLFSGFRADLGSLLGQVILRYLVAGGLETGVEGGPFFANEGLHSDGCRPEEKQGGNSLWIRPRQVSAISNSAIQHPCNRRRVAAAAPPSSLQKAEAPQLGCFPSPAWLAMAYDLH